MKTRSRLSPVKEFCAELREILARRGYLRAVQITRTWNAQHGFSDSFERAKTMVRDVMEDQPWTR